MIKFDKSKFRYTYQSSWTGAYENGDTMAILWAEDADFSEGVLSASYHEPVKKAKAAQLNAALQNVDGAGDVVFAMRKHNGDTKPIGLFRGRLDHASYDTETCTHSYKLTHLRRLV